MPRATTFSEATSQEIVQWHGLGMAGLSASTPSAERMAVGEWRGDEAVLRWAIVLEEGWFAAVKQVVERTRK